MPSLSFIRGGSLRVLVAGAAVLGLAACGGTSAPADTSAADSSTAASATGFPVSITHQFGTTTIDAPPTRVVAAGFNEADYLLAFGVVPVGVRDYIGDFQEETRPWAQEALGGAQPVNIGDEIDFEKVASLTPDLIVGPYSFIEQPDYDKLSAIAPTIGPLTADGNITWQDETTVIGQALGQPDKAKELIASTEQHFADAKAANPEFAGKKLAVLMASDSYTGVLPQDDPRAAFFTNLGFEPPSYSGDIGAEQAQLLDQDVLVVLDAPKDQFTANRLYADLNVVKQNRTVYIGGYATPFAGALGFNSPLSLPYAIDLIVPQLKAAAAGAA